jgi:hypothetical protein
MSTAEAQAVLHGILDDPAARFGRRCGEFSSPASNRRHRRSPRIADPIKCGCHPSAVPIAVRETTMPQPSANTPSDLEVATATAAAARRVALLRDARGEGLQLAECLFGLVAILAVVTIFANGTFLGSYRPAFWAVIASSAIAQAFAVRANRQIRALYALLEDAKLTSTIDV